MIFLTRYKNSKPASISLLAGFCFMLTACENITPATGNGAIQNIASNNTQLSDDLDKIAYQALNKIQPKSILENREYCGIIYELDFEIQTSQAVAGKTDSCEYDGEIHEDAVIIASYHTHGAATFDADTEVPSITDLKADFEEKVTGYTSTPSGRLWRSDWQDKRAIIICGQNCVSPDPKFKECKAMPVLDSYTIKSLKQRERDDRGVC